MIASKCELRAIMTLGSYTRHAAVASSLRRRIHKYARSGFPLLVAQILASLTSLFTNIIVARHLSHDAFGVFSLYYTTILVISGLQVPLLTMPLSVHFASYVGDKRLDYVGTQIRLQLALSFFQATIIAILCNVLLQDGAAGGAALALSVVIVQFYQLIRTIFLAESKLWQMLWLETGISTLRVALLLIAAYGGWLSAESAVAVIGFTCALGLLIAGRTPLTYARFSLPLGVVARQNWHFGRWVLWEAMALYASSQAYIYLTALWLDQRAVAGLAAAQTLVNVVNVILIGISGYALPRARLSLVNRGFDTWRRELILMSSGVLVSSSAVLSGMYFFRDMLLNGIFGAEYGKYVTIIPVLCISSILNILNSFLAIAFRSSELPKAGFSARATSALLSVVLSYPLLQLFGVAGAAVGLLVTQTVWLVVYIAYIRHGALDRERVLARIGMDHAGG